MSKKDAKIYISGHRGMLDSAVWGILATKELEYYRIGK